MKFDVKLLREFTGLDQTEFWKRVGVQQSSGSRYENGRRIPKTLEMLLRLIYIDNVDPTALRREDMDVIAYLKAEQRDQYRDLCREATMWQRKKLRG